MIGYYFSLRHRDFKVVVHGRGKPQAPMKICAIPVCYFRPYIRDAFSCRKHRVSGYHADTPITIKAEAIHEADSRIH